MRRKFPEPTEYMKPMPYCDCTREMRIRYTGGYHKCICHLTWAWQKVDREEATPRYIMSPSPTADVPPTPLKDSRCAVDALTPPMIWKMPVPTADVMPY